MPGHQNDQKNKGIGEQEPGRDKNAKPSPTKTATRTLTRTRMRIAAGLSIHQQLYYLHRLKQSLRCSAIGEIDTSPVV